MNIMPKVFLGCSFSLLAACTSLRGTGDLGVVIERGSGSVQIVETSNITALSQIDGLGDLSHASVVYSRDERYAYIFGRDGGLTKIDILTAKITKRIIQAGNSIGGAISQDGKLVAVSNYKPGGVKVFDSNRLELLADIPATYADGKQKSKVVGLVDAPGQRFVFSLYDAGEIWLADLSHGTPEITRFKNIGKQPYDGLITPDGRYYIAGLFGEDGLAVLDLWHPEQGVKRILNNYGRGSKKMPVYKMPHLEGWAMTEDYAFLPAVGRNEVLVVNRRNWKQVASIPVHGQPVFVMARPDGRQVWVNFAHPRNDTVQVIDTERLQVEKILKPGKAVLHMEFTPRGEHVWISARDAGKVTVYDTESFNVIKTVPMAKPSGIFFTNRAHRTGL
ncbi:cytochrome D1 domain-containing protein [Sulfuriflexus mobilis]|uniref:cytochrome D1 domain-containing protein n=1 Tax=Sulfuriflexus mobilis TaxID=1811807 RepID=UPI0022B2A77E|nr:cytochrome D1 domain-containing protein [Sulfuriflexus mobilis]